MCYMCRFFLFGTDYATCAPGVDFELQSSMCSYILGFRQHMGAFRMSCNLQCGPSLLNIYNNFVIIIFKRTHCCNLVRTLGPPTMYGIGWLWGLVS